MSSLLLLLSIFAHVASPSCLWQDKNLKWFVSENEETNDDGGSKITMLAHAFEFWAASTDFRFVNVSCRSEADIVIDVSTNATTTQSTHRLDFDRNLSSNAFWTLAVHNIGHALGLEDRSSDVESVMNPANVRHYTRLPYADVERLQEIYRCTGVKFIGQLNDCVTRAYYENRVVTFDRCRKHSTIVPRNRSDGTIAFFGDVSINENNQLYVDGKFAFDLTDLNIYRPVRAVALFEPEVLTVIHGNNRQFTDLYRDRFFPETDVLNRHKFDVVPTIIGAGRTERNAALLFDDLGHYYKYDKPRGDGRVWKLSKIGSIDRRLLCERGLCFQRKKWPLNNNVGNNHRDNGTLPIFVLMINLLFIAVVMYD